MYGKGYIVEYCVMRWKQEQEEKLYKNYIADCLYYYQKNLATQFGGEHITARFCEILHPVEEKSADEIFDDVVKSAGLEVITE